MWYELYHGIWKRGQLGPPLAKFERIIWSLGLRKGLGPARIGDNRPTDLVPPIGLRALPTDRLPSSHSVNLAYRSVERRKCEEESKKKKQHVSKYEG